MTEMQESSSSSKRTRKVVQAVSSSDGDDSDEEDDASCVYPALTTLKSATFDHLQQIVSAFSSPRQLPPYGKQKYQLAVRHIDVLQRFMASQWPSKTSLIVRRVLKCGSHAWVPGALHYWADNNKWVECSSYQKFHDKTIELFNFGLTPNGSQCNISYMGSYQAIKLPELRSADFTKLSRASQSDIERKLGNEHKLSIWQARNDILQGRVVMECLGLQYRGFDHVLHNALISFQGPGNARKRKTSSASRAGPQKKKKQRTS
ncbi:hypothetical protein FIBSPDRAFT_1036798 [Athelia psychrophila]|uniref:Uncharacterized protein n=1 Tax=Athelia psychrophila TaxID=1759441 RepID=A0A166VGJ6_9AGAM|nr:hypothetical protein FIBSPDRAFT_1036798 [Fibularhizoctonia sp. CBS 109695]